MNPLNFFKDKSGKIIIAQWPNKPLWIVIGFWILGYIPNAMVQLLCHWGSTLTLIYWSYLEITAGDSQFRRVLGLVVMFYQLKGLIGLMGF